ncbi:MAG: alpha/beta fold hydrolase [Polyangiaceae bacterium]|nr:alpha/beta fold hydrolase [Polyangiaceae bacterium]
MSNMPPFRQYRLDLGAGPMHVREIGPSDAPPLLFLHGVLANARLWYGVAEALSKRYRCVLLDLPLGAHDEAMNASADLSPAGVVALVVEALDELEIPSAILVGNDSGGALCQMLVERHPERLRGLVLTSCDAYDVWLPLLFKPFELAAFVPGALFVVAQLLRFRFVRNLPFALGWLALRMPTEIGASFTGSLARHSWARRDVAKFLRGITPKLTQRAARSFAAFERPVLLVWSKRDRFFSERLARQLLADFPHARLELVHDSYTFSPLDEPAAVAEHIGAFLESVA